MDARSPTRDKTKAKAVPRASKAKTAPRASKVKTASRAGKPRPPELLSGGNPRIEKADGDAPVQAYIAALQGFQRDVVRQLDALIVRHVRGVQKAVKWNSPLYGIAGQGWFLGIHTFKLYVKVAFFSGASLRPLPPGASKGKDTRYLDIREGDELDELQLSKWLKQAAALPGFHP